jgi:hypothetical protein
MFESIIRVSITCPQSVAHPLKQLEEPGSQAIVELRNDGYWTKGNRLLDALDGTSIAAVAMNWNGGITIRVYYQAEDLSLKEYCHDSGRGQYPGQFLVAIESHLCQRN